MGMQDNVSLQKKETGNVSFRAQGAVTGRRFVSPVGHTGPTGLTTNLENLQICKQAIATDVVIGVSKYDVADGESGGMHGQPGMIVRMDSGAAIPVGARVVSDATGRAVPAGTGTPYAAGVNVGGAIAAAGAETLVKLILS